MAKFDVWFEIEHPASFVIEASDAHEARRIAEDALSNMDRKELQRRLMDALDYMGVRIVCVEHIVES